MDEERMSPEELAQAQTGPNNFALNWIQAVGRDEIEVVWRAMTSDFRLAMAQAWLTANPVAFGDPSASDLTRDELAAALATEDPDHWLFPDLARVSLREIKNTYGNLDTSKLGPGLRPRPMGPDLEVVRLFYLPDLDKDDAGNYTFAAEATVRTASVWVQRSGSWWAIAGVGDGLLRPGWPPNYESILRPED